MSGDIDYRSATAADVALMAGCRLTDPAAGPADSRMAAYFDGQHHPQRALMPRTGYVALADGVVIGYIAGHLTTRYDCAAEVQYLFVAPEYRRRRVASTLLRLLADWFTKNSAIKVCVCVDSDSPAAEPFYQRLGAARIFPEKRYWYVWQDIQALRTHEPQT